MTDTIKAKTSKRFAKVYIEISNLCNLQCSFCPEVLRDKKILAATDFKKIIEAVEPFTDRITLHLMGEPLLHPQFIEIMTIVKASSLRVELTTNAILLKRQQDLLLQSAAIRQINFSLQSYMDNFPGKALENYLAPILEFTEAAQALRPDLFVNFRLWSLQAEPEVLRGNKLKVKIPQSQQLQQSEPPQRLPIPQDLVALLQLFSVKFKAKLPEAVDVRAQKSWKLTDKVRIHWDTRFEWPSLDNTISNPKGFCYGLKSQIGIHADGTVVPCCLDKEAKINLGNILQSSLAEILATTRAKSILSNFARGLACEELCQKCSFKDRFKNKI
jgi:radical SAM protein with 4Fe4S-binding SPASM domain